MDDILKDLGYLALGSRLKRLADRLLADAAIIHAESGEPLQPGQFPLIAAIDRYGPLSVNAAADALGISQPAATRAANELARAGLIDSSPSAQDKRGRTLSLSDAGRASIARLKATMWPRVEAEARALCTGLSGDILADLSRLENRLADRSMHRRVTENRLEIVDFADALAPHFYEINAEWIEAMFVLEDHDRHVLLNPRDTIIDPGGEILFVRDTGAVGADDASAGIIGACALQPDANGYTELTKMGVRSSVRGLKAGEFLLRAVLERARARGFTDTLFLVTNWKCEAAIHLYEKVGFVHDPEMMDQFGARYERCDVAMRYRP